MIYANDNQMLKDATVDYVLKFPNLEADDIIAIMKNMIRQKYPDAKIYIIANDHDYLQLLDDNTEIINFQMKSLRENKKVFPEADKNLFYKIVLGDKSDCIPSVFSKCGPKTVEKYYNDPKELEKAFEKEGQKARERFERNKKIIAFTEIPCELVQKFTETNNESLKKLLSIKQ
jgi:5'-3' exonuclease